MSTKAGTMGVSARPTAFTLWTAAVSALAVTALIMSAVALNLAVRSDERAALPAPRMAVASGSVISGTGPGLIQVAEGAARTAPDRAALERGRRADAARWVAQAEAAWLAQDDRKP